MGAAIALGVHEVAVRVRVVGIPTSTRPTRLLITTTSIGTVREPCNHHGSTSKMHTSIIVHDCKNLYWLVSAWLFHVMSRQANVTSHRAMSSQVTPCHIMYYHITECRIESFRLISVARTSCHLISRIFCCMARRTTPRHVKSRLATFCHFALCHVLSYQIMAALQVASRLVEVCVLHGTSRQVRSYHST